MSKTTLDTVLVFRYDLECEQIFRKRASSLGISASCLYRKVLDQYLARLSLLPRHD